jgi:HlyD family secretion protein
MKRSSVGLLVGAGVVAVCAVVVLVRNASGKDPGYKLVAVTRGPVVEKAVATGALRPEREIAVKSKISGIVRRSFREVGDRVAAGEPLFQIIPDPTPLELTEARRDVEIARNVFEQARKGHERSKALAAEGVLSSQDMDQAEKDVEDAKIRLKLSEDRLALVEKGRVKTEGSAAKVESVIRAPVSGTVLELLVNEGDPVVPLSSFQAGTPLATLADMSTLLFKGTVDEIDVGKLKDGMTAQIRVGALPDAKVQGTISKIAPKSKTQEGTTLFEVEIAITSAENVVLRSGYSANADIAVREKKSALLVPERLVTFDQGKASVEIPGAAAGEPTKRDVTVGLSDGMQVEIVTGLAFGEKVVERPPKKIE